MRMMLMILATLSCVLIACASDEANEATIALDTNGNGGVDCTDLDHVLACIHHPGSEACVHADVNHDGMVDDADVHDLHHALSAEGHHCAEPEHHDPAGDHTGSHVDAGH